MIYNEGDAHSRAIAAILSGLTPRRLALSSLSTSIGERTSYRGYGGGGGSTFDD